MEHFEEFIKSLEEFRNILSEEEKGLSKWADTPDGIAILADAKACVVEMAPKVEAWMSSNREEYSEVLKDVGPLLSFALSILATARPELTGFREECLLACSAALAVGYMKGKGLL